MKDKYNAKKPLEYESTRFINENLDWKKSEERLKLLFELAPDAYYLYDSKGNIIDGNRAAEELAGYKRDELVGKNLLKIKLLSPGQIPKAAAILARNVLGKPTGPDEFILNRKDGAKVIVEIRTHPIKVDGQSLVLAIARDITERRRVEAELRQRESSLAEAQRIAHLGNWDWDIINNELRWSDEIYRIFGLAPQEFSATYEAFLKSVHPDDREFVKKSVNEALYEKKSYNIDHRIVLPDNTERIIHEQAEVVFDETGKAIRMTGTVQDITERKKIEVQLIRQTKVLDAINKVFRKALTSKTEEELGKSCLAAAEELTSSKFGFIGEVNETGLFDTIAISNPGWDACTLPNSKAMRIINNMEIRGIDRSTIREERSRIVNGDELKSHPDWVGIPEGHPPLTAFLGVPMKDAGKTIGMIGLGNKELGYDSADQEAVEALSVAIVEALRNKRAEEALQRAHNELEMRVEERTVQLKNANKELASFSYSVSHDLRTPLRAIDGFARILLDEYNDKFDDEGKRVINIIRDNTNRMGQLIDDLLDFSRTGRKEIELSNIDMEDLAKSVFEELKAATDGRKIEFKIEPLAPAKGDIAMIRQVFVNLLSNALKYTRPKEYAVIEVGGRAEGGENIYYVKDNGAGFDMEYVDKLFGIFQRLHGQDEFEGTGVGLAIIQRIIQKHGGRVWAEGKEEEGATFYFSIPGEKMEV